jgi:anti-sigma regulatory factor (Ser/Thr protein kinase)
VYPLTAHAASPAAARVQVQRAITDRASDEQLERAVLIVSELVTNAVMHGAEPIRLELAFVHDGLLIGVFDASADASVVILPDPSRVNGVGGRGLRIVQQLASSWGVEQHDTEKRVWAVVAI